MNGVDCEGHTDSVGTTYDSECGDVTDVGHWDHAD